MLAEADWVVASIPCGQNQPREKITRRLLNAIKNPYVHAIGLPRVETVRYLLRG